MRTSAALLRHARVLMLNLSASGCEFETRHQLGVGTVGSLELQFDDHKRREWFRITRVRASTATHGGYRCGAEFLRLSLVNEHSLRGAFHPVAGENGEQGISASAGTLSGETGRSPVRPMVPATLRHVAPREFPRESTDSVDSPTSSATGSAVADSAPARHRLVSASSHEGED